MLCLCSLIGILWCHVLCLSFQAILSLFLCVVRGCVPASLIYMQLSNLCNTTCWRDCIFLIVYSCILCWRLTDCRCVGLFLDSLFGSIDLFVFVPIPWCFDYWSFVVFSEVWEGYASCFILFLQTQFWVSYCSIWVLELFVLVLWKMSWVICKSLSRLSFVIGWASSHKLKIWIEQKGWPPRGGGSSPAHWFYLLSCVCNMLAPLQLPYCVSQFLIIDLLCIYTFYWSYFLKETCWIHTITDTLADVVYLSTEPLLSSSFWNHCILSGPEPVFPQSCWVFLCSALYPAKKTKPYMRFHSFQVPVVNTLETIAHCRWLKEGMEASWGSSCSTWQ